MTPTPSHLLRFDLVCCAKGVSDLISHPVVSFFGSGMGSTACTGANMITKSVDKTFSDTSTRQEGQIQCRYFRTDTSGEECLSESRRPGLISEIEYLLISLRHL